MRGKILTLTITFAMVFFVVKICNATGYTYVAGQELVGNAGLTMSGNYAGGQFNFTQPITFDTIKWWADNASTTGDCAFKIVIKNQLCQTVYSSNYATTTANKIASPMFWPTYITMPAPITLPSGIFNFIATSTTCNLFAVSSGMAMLTGLNAAGVNTVPNVNNACSLYTNYGWPISLLLTDTVVTPVNVNVSGGGGSSSSTLATSTTDIDIGKTIALADGSVLQPFNLFQAIFEIIILSLAVVFLYFNFKSKK